MEKTIPPAGVREGGKDGRAGGGRVWVGIRKSRAQQKLKAGYLLPADGNPKLVLSLYKATRRWQGRDAFGFGSFPTYVLHHGSQLEEGEYLRIAGKKSRLARSYKGSGIRFNILPGGGFAERWHIFT